MKSRETLDKLGMCASALCAVHCLVTGVALGLISAFGLGFLGSRLADVAFLGLAVLIGGFAIWHGRRRHGSSRPAAIFCLGLALVVVGHFGFGHNHGTGGAATLFSVAGGLAFVAFHILNIRMGASGMVRCPGCAVDTAPSATDPEPLPQP
jgi:hypothetical protein